MFCCTLHGNTVTDTVTGSMSLAYMPGVLIGCDAGALEHEWQLAVVMLQGPKSQGMHACKHAERHVLQSPVQA